MNKFQKKIKRKYLIREHLRILNSLFELSERELQILALLVEIDMKWVPSFINETKDIISTNSRKVVIEETRVNKSNLSTYIAGFKQQGIIVALGNGWEINRSLIPILTPITDEEGNIVIEEASIVNFILTIDSDDSNN